jgi:DNA-binding PucR family transcriptional regulator
MYRQAETALMIGLSEKPMEWIHRFSNYTLQYIYNLLTSNSDLGQLYSPIYYRLERYDKENGSSYLETLRVYLNCNMNAVQAAKELFIQRSTMIYRLKRIREIAENDLEDRDDLLHLYLTFSIIERENNKPYG